MNGLVSHANGFMDLTMLKKCKFFRSNMERKDGMNPVHAMILEMILYK